MVVFNICITTYVHICTYRDFKVLYNFGLLSSRWLVIKLYNGFIKQITKRKQKKTVSLGIEFCCYYNYIVPMIYFS